ncbi:MAG: hypothetical protein ABSB09_00935 [Acidimicrobiales bacterium]
MSDEMMTTASDDEAGNDGQCDVNVVAGIPTASPFGGPNSGADQFVIAEYAALRAEIGRYQDHQKQVMNFVVLVVGGSLALVVPVLLKTYTDRQRVLDILLIVPVFCCLLCLIYYDRTVRIIRLAHYLATVVNCRASMLSGIPNVWSWETYKRETTIVSRRLALWVDRVRWLMFLLPACAFPFLFFTFGGKLKNNGSALVFLIVDVCVLLGTVIIVFKVEETQGVVGDPDE